jgi:ProP effector
MSELPGIKSKKRERREAWRAAQFETLLILRQRFPQAFASLNARTRRPLKVGIHADIAAALPDLSALEISRALGFYCRDRRYHAACIEGAERIGLDGEPAGTVTAAGAEHAKRAIAAIDERRREQRTAPTPSSSSPSLPAPTPAPLPAPAPTPTSPKRLSLSGLRAAATARKLEQQGA